MGIFGQVWGMRGIGFTEPNRVASDRLFYLSWR